MTVSEKTFADGTSKCLLLVMNLRLLTPLVKFVMNNPQDHGSPMLKQTNKMFLDVHRREMKSCSEMHFGTI